MFCAPGTYWHAVRRTFLSRTVCIFQRLIFRTVLFLTGNFCVSVVCSFIHWFFLLSAGVNTASVESRGICRRGFTPTDELLFLTFYYYKKLRKSRDKHITDDCPCFAINGCKLNFVSQFRYLRHMLCNNHARRSLSMVGGTHSGQSTPHYCPPLIHLHPPRNGVKSHSMCGTESWTELELAFHLTATFLIRLHGPNDSLH